MLDSNIILEIKNHMMYPFNDDNRTNTNDRHHFQVGRQIHTSNYYYDKYYFQILTHSDLITNLLVDRLLQAPFNINDITLLGVGSYCSVFLNNTVNRLIQERAKLTTEIQNVNYAIINNDTQDLSFVFEPELNKNIVIILPLTYTFSRCFEIEKLLTDKITRFKGQEVGEKIQVIKEFISVFLVADNLLRIEALENDTDYLISNISCKRKKQKSHVENLKELYTSFGWYSISGKRLTFIDNPPYKNHCASFLISLKATLYFGEKCKYCFPAQAYKEKALLPIRNNYDSPNLIYNLPQFKNTKGRIGTIGFREGFSIHEDSGHLFGHLRIDNNSFLHYVQRDKFFTNNKEAILEFFAEELNNLFGDLTKMAGNLMIISPVNKKGADILDEMLKRGIFPKEKTSIVYTDPSNEFLENFLINNEDLSHYQHVIYFDYVLSKGNTFKLISDYLKYVRNDKGFDAMLVVTDRTTEYSKKELLRKIALFKETESEAEKRFIAFFKLNLPLLDATNQGNPILEHNLQLKEIFNYCQLDSLRQIIREEIKSGKAKSLSELANENYSYGTIKRSFYLKKLHASHETSNWIHKFIYVTNAGKELRKIKFTLGNLKTLIGDVTDIIWPGADEVEREKCVQIIIETFTHTPFKFYAPIYLATFEFIKEKLIALTEGLIAAGQLLKGETDIEIMGFYLLRSVELNINFILSDYFFSTLRETLEKPENFENVVGLDLNSILYLYKRLTFRNPARSIRLEELLNTPRYLPKPLQEKDREIELSMADNFYMMGRLLKAENNFILHELKDMFIKQIDEGMIPEDTSVDLSTVRKYIYDNYLSKGFDRTNKQLRNFQSFIRQSKELLNGKPDLREDCYLPGNICNATVSMLLAVYRIEKDKKQHDMYIKNARTILQDATNIIGEGLDFAFCIEYKERDPNNPENQMDSAVAKNIYTISSDLKDPRPKILKSGIIYKMLYGLSVGRNKNLQTFIALIRTKDEQFIAFQNEYFSSDQFGSEDDDGVINITDAVLNDINSGTTGVIGKQANMILLFRLADIGLEDAPEHKGQAILVVTSDLDPTTENFTAFMNMERIRILLVMKNKLMEYIKSQFENDAFIGLLNDQAKLEYKNSMQHMLDNYFLAIESLLDKNKLLDDSDIRMFNFIMNKIRRHVLSMGEEEHDEEDNNEDDSLIDMELLGNFSREKIEYNQGDLVELFEGAMTMPRLARMILVDKVDRTQRIRIEKPFLCEPVIFEQVIMEIIINMRRYAIESAENPIHFEIYQFDSQLIFENPYDPATNNNPTSKPKGHGKEMCNKILTNYNHLPLDDYKISDNKYQVILDLKTITK